MKSFSVTRKSRTSACRHSMCSTRKMPHNLSSGRKSPGVADVVAAVDAAGEAAGAAAAAAAAAGLGASAAGVKHRVRLVVFAAMTSAGCRSSQRPRFIARQKLGSRIAGRAHPRNRHTPVVGRRGRAPQNRPLVLRRSRVVGGGGSSAQVGGKVIGAGRGAADRGQRYCGSHRR